MPLTQPKTDLAYLRSEKAKAEQKLRACQHREKILERQMSKLNRRACASSLHPCRNAGKLSGLSGRADRRSGDGTAENLIPSTGSRAGACKDGA